MLFIELKSEEVTERDLLLKELSVENSSLSVLLDLRVRRITNQLLKRELEENYLPWESLTLTGLDKTLPLNSLRFSWLILLIMPSEMMLESIGFVTRNTEKWEVWLQLVRNIEVLELKEIEIIREDHLLRLITREEI